MKNLSLDKLNGFLCSFDQVEKFDLNYVDADNGYTLTLVLSENILSENTEKLVIKFLYISDLSLHNSFLNNFQQFTSLIIERNYDQLENVKYQISQIEDDNITFKCKEILSYLT